MMGDINMRGGKGLGHFLANTLLDIVSIPAKYALPFADSRERNTYKDDFFGRAVLTIIGAAATPYFAIKQALGREPFKGFYEFE
jgi:hypothetical protein